MTLEAFHTQDEELRGFDFSKVQTGLSRTVQVIDKLHEEFGEDRDGVVVIPAAE